MKQKILSIIAAVVGGLCIAFAAWMQYMAVSVAATMPYAAGHFDSRYFWWPVCAAALFWSLACFGFIWHRN
jgi:hypothetical protein